MRRRLLHIQKFIIIKIQVTHCVSSVCISSSHKCESTFPCADSPRRSFLGWFLQQIAIIVVSVDFYMCQLKGIQANDTYILFTLM